MNLKNDELEINSLFIKTCQKREIDRNYRLLFLRIMNTQWICNILSRDLEPNIVWENFHRFLHNINTIYENPGRRLELELWNFLSKIVPWTSLTSEKVDRVFQYDLLVPSEWEKLVLWLQITTHPDSDGIKRMSFFKKCRANNSWVKWKKVIPVYIKFNWSRIYQKSEQESIFMSLWDNLQPLLYSLSPFSPKEFSENIVDIAPPMQISDKWWNFTLWAEKKPLRHEIGELSINTNTQGH